MDFDVLLKKLESVPKGKLQIYKQDQKLEIVPMINRNLAKMWRELTSDKIDETELKFLIKRFENAFITNLIDTDAINDMDVIFSKILTDYNGSLDNIFRSQLLAENNMPEPGPKCIYIPDDVIGAAKKYVSLKGKSGSDPEKKKAVSGLLATLGAYFSGINATYVIFDDAEEFERFKATANQMLFMSKANQIPDSFNISQKIYDGIILRKDYTLDNESCNPKSFARVMAAAVTWFFSSRMLPTKIVESFLPSAIIFFNAPEIASAISARIQSVKRDFGVLQSLDRERVMSFKEIASLEEVVREKQRFNSIENQLDSAFEKPKKSTLKEQFHITDINLDRTRKKLLQIEKNMKKVQYSRNPNREYEIETYQRPNRRDPRDPDLPGNYQELGCYPDIHLYVDTSGSITQKDYEASVMMIVDIAKKMNCDIYFNTFSTVISQETLIRCRSRSVKAILNEISKIPKVTGGTTIDQVWKYINQYEKNRKQLSIIISDFWVDVPRYIKHPVNLYYIPIKNPYILQVETFTKKLDHLWRMLY